MAIDPRIEGSLRKMLGHAIRHELDDLAALAVAEGKDTYEAATRLCVLASGYIAIDVSERWPLEADLREIASHAAKSVTRLPITESDIYVYLSRVVLGLESPLEVFAGNENAPLIPLFATANLVLSFGRQNLEWWEYLDQIWDAVEIADQTKSSVLPALMYRVRAEAAHAARQSTDQQ